MLIEIPISDELIDAIACRLGERLQAPRAASLWLTVRQAAEYLSLSQNSIRALIKRNRIPHHKVEGRILFEQGELDAWVRQRGV